MEWVGGNRFLTMDEMKLNATYIWNYLGSKGWTLQAVCGMLGNMQSESSINPAIWQNLDEGNLSLGYGLVQWTPSTKYFNWCDENGLLYGQMDSNLLRIIYEVENNIQWGNSSTGQAPPFNFYEFTQSTLAPYTLAMYFLVHYERPRDQNQPNRGTQAEFWWSYLDGTDPQPPDPIPPFIGRKTPLFYFLRKI